jgi:hypothetical protein
MIQSVFDIRHERILESMALAQKKYNSAVRPIYGIHRRGVAPIHIGSCVLLSLRETRFLVTAGHVTDRAKSTRLQVAGTKELIPLSFDSGLTTNPGKPRDEDVYDFSVCALSAMMQRELGEVTYIAESDIYKAFPLGRNRLRMVIGYPTSKNRKGIDNPRMRVGGTVWTYASLPVEDADAASILGVPTGDHLLIEFDHKKSINPDGIGAHSINPAGASGGAMFDLGKPDDPEWLAKLAQCEAKLAGILTEYRSRNKAIVATSMKPVLDFCRGLLSMGVP